MPAARLQWPEHAALAHPAERMHSVEVDAALRAAASAMALQKGGVCRRQGAALAAALAIEDAMLRFRAARLALYTAEGRPRQYIDAPGVAAALELIEQIQRACVQQSAHEEHLRLVRLARALLREAATYKRARGLADMADLERCALALLRDATLSGWVQERLDSRIRHVLIDEFQDTSPLQWHALHAWLAGYAGAGGGASGQRAPGVFIVGDPKQSIYRFRRAEPRVFDAAREFIVQGLGGSGLACDHTRRNAPEVLAVVNAVFEEAQRQGEYSGFRAHTTECASAPGAGVHALPRIARPAPPEAVTDRDDRWRDSLTAARIEPEARAREPEARAVAAAAQRLVMHDGFRPGDIHVLCRKRETLGLVAIALAALHLPHAAAEDYPLLESIEARDLVAVLDVLASPRHALSLAHALRSPLFCAGDDDLIALAELAAVHGSWWLALLRGETASPALRRAARLLAAWQAAARSLPPHDLLDRIVAEGEFKERVAAAVPRERRVAALGAIDALLGVSLTLDGARYATPYNFVRALKRGAISVAAPAQRDAIQLHTVHGAKGLEARAVFVVDSDPEPKNGDSATLLVEWPVESSHPTLCAFVYSELNCPPSLEAVRDREFAARRREELNGLYVAMTRARERLVFSATEPFREGAEASWWQRVEGRVAPLAAESG
ncbi:MAG: UvrD-helicase domain-containing protein, partial [Caldimonas sp.]